MIEVVESGFSRYRTLSFDCYGTLIDWESGLQAELVPWSRRHGLDLDETRLLTEFAGIESIVQSEKPDLNYRSVLAEVLRRLGQAFGVVTTEAEERDFGDSVGRWPAFADSAAALARLKERFQLVILSNIDRASFAQSRKLLGVEFDLVLTAEEIGSYKPDLRNFEYLINSLSALGSSKAELLHVAQSLFHDHVPAQTSGLETVWIDRQGGRNGATPPPPVRVAPTWTFPDLASFTAEAT